MNTEQQITPHASKHHGSGKIEGSWKGMKKYLEQDMLCDSLKGQVVYHCTHHPRFSGLGTLFSVSLCGKVIKKFCAAYAWSQLNKKGVSLSYIDDVDNDIPVSERDEYTQYDFSEALDAYRHIPIKQAITNNNPIVRMFAIVDRRIGKRTLMSLRDQVDKQPDWLKPLYLARLESEGISPALEQ